MANSYSQFSTILPLNSEEEAEWCKNQLAADKWVYDAAARRFFPAEQEVGNRMVPVVLSNLVLASDGLWEPASEDTFIEHAGFCWDIDTAEDGSWELWLYAEEYVDADAVGRFVQSYLRRFALERCWSTSIALTCSKPRLDSFGGMLLFVTAHEVTMLYVSDMARRLEKDFAEFTERGDVESLMTCVAKFEKLIAG